MTPARDWSDGQLVAVLAFCLTATIVFAVAGVVGLSATFLLFSLVLGAAALDRVQHAAPPLEGMLLRPTPDWSDGQLAGVLGFCVLAWLVFAGAGLGGASATFFLLSVVLAALAGRRLLRASCALRAWLVGERHVTRDELDPTVEAIVASYTGGTFRRLQPRPWLAGDDGRLTDREVRDLVRQARAEVEEMTHTYRTIHARQEAAAAAERSQARVALLKSLSAQERGLLAAWMEAESEAGRKAEAANRAATATIKHLEEENAALRQQLQAARGQARRAS